MKIIQKVVNTLIIVVVFMTCTACDTTSETQSESSPVIIDARNENKAINDNSFDCLIIREADLKDAISLYLGDSKIVYRFGLKGSPYDANVVNTVMKDYIYLPNGDNFKKVQTDLNVKITFKSEKIFKIASERVVDFSIRLEN